MAVLNIINQQVGLVGTIPGIGYINTNDSLATVTAAGYLNNQNIGKALSPQLSQFKNGTMCLVSNTTQTTTWLVLTKSSSGIYTLSNPNVTFTKVNGTESGGNVTANGSSGQITTSSLTTAAGSTYTITFSNSSIASNSTLLLQAVGGTNTRLRFNIQVTALSSGSATLVITNFESSNALNGTIIFAYQVF